MFWRSVVGKLWFTFLLVMLTLLTVISVLLMDFFNKSGQDEAKQNLLHTTNQVGTLIDDYPSEEWTLDIIDRIKDETTRVVVIFDDQSSWVSHSADETLPILSNNWLLEHDSVIKGLDYNQDVTAKVNLTNGEDVLIAGKHFDFGIIFSYQNTNNVHTVMGQSKSIVGLIAIVIVVIISIFAYFLSKKITAPLIKMRKAALEIANGEFKTKVPILTHDEIGELAMAFNRMGRQLNYHMNELKHEKELLYSILGSMADGVMTVNRDKEIIISNPQADKFLEDSRFELNTKTNNLLPLELESFVNEAMETEKEQFRELEIQGRIWVIILSPLYDQTQVRGVVAVIRDMTEERKLDQLRESFIANVSHELRTPIALLQGYSEAIIDDVASSKEEQAELAKIILDESLRMKRLVNDLLDLARIKAGQIDLSYSKVNLIDFLENIAVKFNGLLKEKELNLIYKVDPTVSEVMLDSDRIEQVVVILIDNAIRHTQSNGKIEITVNYQSEAFHFIIKDNGEGIPQKDLPFIFERFYKADKSRRRNETVSNGTGLGLAIAKQIVEAHGGTIDVQSKENAGTTFVFTIPKIYLKGERN